MFGLSHINESEYALPNSGDTMIDRSKIIFFLKDIVDKVKNKKFSQVYRF